MGTAAVEKGDDRIRSRVPANTMYDPPGIENERQRVTIAQRIAKKLGTMSEKVLRAHQFRQ
jgi:hypothetical protein